jgi:hypothetical protein
MIVTKQLILKRDTSLKEAPNAPGTPKTAQSGFKLAGF